jgi:hypothetical protein
MNLSKEIYKDVTNRLKKYHLEAKQNKEDKGSIYYQNINDINSLLIHIHDKYGIDTVSHIYQAICIDLGENLGPLHYTVLQRLTQGGFKFKLRST